MNENEQTRTFKNRSRTFKDRSRTFKDRLRTFKDRLRTFKDPKSLKIIKDPIKDLKKITNIFVRDPMIFFKDLIVLKKH